VLLAIRLAKRNCESIYIHSAPNITIFANQGLRSSTHTFSSQKVCVLDRNPWLAKMPITGNKEFSTCTWKDNFFYTITNIIYNVYLLIYLIIYLVWSCIALYLWNICWLEWCYVISTKYHYSQMNVSQNCLYTNDTITSYGNSKCNFKLSYN